MSASINCDPCDDWPVFIQNGELSTMLTIFVSRGDLLTLTPQISHYQESSHPNLFYARVVKSVRESALFLRSRQIRKIPELNQTARPYDPEVVYLSDSRLG